MHLLAAKPGGFTDEEGIIDLQQTPADVIILSAQDTLINILADCASRHEDLPFSLRLANLLHLNKPAAFDLYYESVLKHAKVIIVSLLGGENYWPYGVEQLRQHAEFNGCTLIFVPGDDSTDTQLQSYSTAPDTVTHHLWRYLREAGRDNIHNFYRHIAKQWFGATEQPAPPKPIPNVLLHDKNQGTLSLAQWQAVNAKKPYVVALLFYKSHLQSGNTAAFEAFADTLIAAGLAPLTIVINSLKDPNTLDTVQYLLEKSAAQLVINTTGFSVRSQENATLSSLPNHDITPYHGDLPIIQAISASGSEEDWEEYDQGLRARDVAMSVALPELDGRIISRAITFKESKAYSDTCEVEQIIYRLHTERAQYVAALAQRWIHLRLSANSEKRIALILANYPTKEGRIGNGVGLDTPASTIRILHAMKAAGYSLSDIPASGDALISQLLDSVTNDLDTLSLRSCNQSISEEDYLSFFHSLPIENQEAVLSRWGQPHQSPKYRKGRLMVSGIRLNNVFVGIQPARGFNIDAAASYHDPDLVPPHDYIAFYCWLRNTFDIDAISHIGKHGNLEWLPGKGLALSEQCWPDALLGPLPHLYPFIVNDPGEGAQAKRRTQAVIVDHLMPPMARAESYGDLVELENLVDEFYQALGLDPQRETFLRNSILDCLRSSDILQELPSYHSMNDTASKDNEEVSEALLGELDAYLCELKEAQIRNGLHRFGDLPEHNEWNETLLSLLRLPRGHEVCDLGILHALAQDFSLSNVAADREENSVQKNLADVGFNPLSIDAAAPWRGDRPAPLMTIGNDSLGPWRTEADTRERLELFALQLIEIHLCHDAEARVPLSELNAIQFPLTRQLLESVTHTVLPAFASCGPNEITAMIDGFAGRFIQPGPSGAPTRGRLDTLPTGRNFFSVDNRSIPTPAACELGKKSAAELIDRHLQEHGDYPTTLGLSVWGTSTMRTGGDDIAQAFALMGIELIRSPGTNRVADFTIIPSFLMSHPRVDVTLRISGFFRDAFPQVINLFDAAVNALYEYEEPGNSNPIRETITAEAKALIDAGVSTEEATAQAQWRIFGSKPGSYGAGLQGLIDERVWDTKEDLAQAYINWGGYAYSGQEKGKVAFQAFANRLSEMEVVVQNQDNREHDLLDSDDYYQFQGGLANAVRVMSDKPPTIYHGDHSNPASPKIKTLKEELNKVIRSRALNPKWINAMQQHGYKGAFEMAATVDYLFAYDATTDLVDDYQYAAITERYLLDEQNQQFLEEHNPNAMKEMAERLHEAIQRGMWEQPGEMKAALENTIINIENMLERS